MIAWVRSYPTREDEYGLGQHRALFEAFPGWKRELTRPEYYDKLLQPGQGSWNSGNG
ncbi:hypothetical protein CPCC7001_2740 [Cyanobium sp. PCC 7001]|uniref:hypothetical protein n=1 Tax=Cyanobium sp. PCC 7001 TaxID=180281 RepID=UPI000180499B|nr:hypothetical protein [Cyanobium sp. PCC 7001]EDY39858.1 hypothetical protein CPCC7001_2740 [Cyanobium sp. PCC 7001]